MTTRRSLFQRPLVWVLFGAIILATTVGSLLRDNSGSKPSTPTYGELPPFSLVRENGEPFGSEDLAGSVYVASFVFTRCPSLCPMIMESVARLQDRYRKEDVPGIRLVSFSVDPEHDRPEQLREYAAEHGADPERWTLLTGDDQALRELLVEGFGVGMGEPVEIGENMIDIAHTGKLVLVDGQGGILGYYAYDTEWEELFERSRDVAKASIQ